MKELEFGQLAISLAGHDKGNLYVINSSDFEYVYLVDGKYKTLCNPKKKNKKHIQPIKEVDMALLQKKELSTLTDVDIKRTIKLYLGTCN